MQYSKRLKTEHKNLINIKQLVFAVISFSFLFLMIIVASTLEFNYMNGEEELYKQRVCKGVHTNYRKLTFTFGD